MVARKSGEEETVTFTFPIEKGKVREFADAIYDDNPVYWDENEAKKKFGGIPLPPTFTEVSRYYDGLAFQRRTLQDVALGLDGGREIEYLRPVYVGDVLTGQSKVVDVYERRGRRGGKMILTVTETVFHNQKGEKVIVVRATGIRTSQVVEA